jgi:exodeoxyribonuclease VII large subunit
VAGIRAANQLARRPDVLIVGRGGGSLEDLWSFNEEAVVRAIFASEIPVVSAVGHEIDVTLSDLVADRRALTPSEAAELVVPAADELNERLAVTRGRLATALKARLLHARARLDALAQSRVLRRPLDGIHDLSRYLDELQLRAVRAVRQSSSQAKERLAGFAGRLESLSPLAVLARGYSLTKRSHDGRLITDAGQVAAGDQITTRLARGQLHSRVEQGDVDD